MKQAREIAQLIKVLDGLRDWRKSFAESKKPFIDFMEISECTQLDGLGDGNGWEGPLIIPRELAIDMMDFAIKKTEDELTNRNVDAIE